MPSRVRTICLFVSLLFPAGCQTLMTEEELATNVQQQTLIFEKITTVLKGIHDVESAKLARPALEDLNAQVHPLLYDLTNRSGIQSREDLAYAKQSLGPVWKDFDMTMKRLMMAYDRIRSRPDIREALGETLALKHPRIAADERAAEARRRTKLTYSMDALRPGEDPRSLGQEVKACVERRLFGAGLEDTDVALTNDGKVIVRVPRKAPEAAEEVKKLLSRSGYFSMRRVAYPLEPSDELLASVDQEEQDYLEKDRIWLGAKQRDPDLDIRRPRPPKRIVRQARRAEGETAGRVPVRRLLENDHEYDDETRNWVPQFVVHADLERVEATFDQGSRPSASFELTPRGARRLGEITEGSRGRMLAILLGHEVIQVATIRSRIGGRGELTGNFTDRQVRLMVALLDGGNLPARLTLTGEEVE